MEESKAEPKRQFTAIFAENLSDFTVKDRNDIERIKKVLDEWGFVVIENCLSLEECKHAETLMNTDLSNSVNDKWLKPHPEGKSSLYQVLKDFREGKELFPKYSIPGLAKKGFLCLAGLPHGKFAWALRTNPIVRSIYAELYGCKERELCVSLDIPFYNSYAKSNAQTDIWCHADQNINVDIGSSNIYQGILYVWDSTNEMTSNTVVIPKSHKDEYLRLLSAIPESMYNGHSNMYFDRIPDETERDLMLDIWREKARRIPVPAGGLLIFNSRTIHQGYQGGLRLAQTICWEKKTIRSEEAYMRKLQACIMLFPTTHWASLGIHHPVSFGTKLREAKYDGRKHHNNVLPIKCIESEALQNPSKFKFNRKIPLLTIEEMEREIKPEYLEVL